MKDLEQKIRVLALALMAPAAALCIQAKASPLAAADDAGTDTVAQLRELRVTAQHRRLTPAQVIGRMQIEALPSASVADALKYLAGVQIKDYGGLGGQKTVNVRSLGAQHVGVYIDGVRVTNAQNGTVDLGKYSLSTLESVSLYNANKNETMMTASEYASASTIYLQTRRPDRSLLTASASAGSFGTYKGALTYMFAPSSHAHDRQLTGFVDAAYTTSRGDYPFTYRNEYEDTTGVRRNSDIRMLRVEAAAFYRGLQFHAYYFDSERGLPGGVVRRLSDAYTDVGREWDRNFFTQFAYRGNLGRWGLRAIAKYSNDRLHYRTDYPENISAHLNNLYLQQDLYGAVAAAYTIPIGDGDDDVRLSLSTDLRWSDLDCDVKNLGYVYRLDSKTSVAAFYRSRGFNLSASALYTSVADHTRGVDTPLRRLTYNLLGTYSFGGRSKSAWLRGLTLRAFYKSVFRAPTLNDLYYTTAGNRRLRPEYTRQLNIGAVYTAALDGGISIDAQLDAYSNRVTDRIVCMPLKGSYQWTMLNYGRTRSYGVNLSLGAGMPLPGRDVRHHLLVTATAQDDRDRTDPAEDSYGDLIAYSPQWAFTAVYDITAGGLGASLSHMYVGKRYWTAENDIEPPLAPYNCTDAKVSYRWRMLTAEAECQNLFNTRYEIIQRWPMPGRRYMFTLKLQI